MAAYNTCITAPGLAVAPEGLDRGKENQPRGTQNHEEGDHCAGFQLTETFGDDAHVFSSQLMVALRNLMGVAGGHMG